MNKVWIILNFVVLAYLILACLLGTFYKHISFGWGLGDIFGYAFLYLLTLIHLSLTIYFQVKGTFDYKYLALAFLLFSIILSLYATLWRGNEYRWNGSIFYTPCPQKIEIKDQEKSKQVLVSMCTMEYFSSFEGVWDGTYLSNVTGEIKIPIDLNKYIESPVTKVFIIPKSDTSQVKVDHLDIDSLVVSRRYAASGEVIKIYDKVPVFEVRIKK